MTTDARNPQHRIEILPSTQHVKVVVGGEVVADSTRPLLLLEGALPVRYYIPPEDVRVDLLEPSDTSTT